MNNFAIRRSKGGRIIWEQSQIDFIIQKYNEGMTPPKISALFGINAEHIRKVLRQNNIHIKTVRERALEKYPRDSFYFNKIDTREKAYWLGFLYADGCVSTNNNLQISIKDSDYDHLDAFRKAIGAINHKIVKTQKKDKFGWHFSIRDKQLCDDLKAHGCIERKSLILKFPTKEQVPEEFIYDFLRGYFDGDGTISLDRRFQTPQVRVGFCGTFEFLQGVEKVLGLTNSLVKISIENSYSFNVQGNKKGKVILDKLYQNSPSIYLKRKYDIYYSFFIAAHDS